MYEGANLISFSEGSLTPEIKSVVLNMGIITLIYHSRVLNTQNSTVWWTFERK